MSRKVWILGAVALLFGGAFVGVWWRNAGEAAPQTVALPNGVTYRFAGMTYGTNHIMGSRLELAVQKMPKPLANIARQLLGSRLGTLNTHTTSKPSFCVWFEPLGTNGVSTTTTIFAMFADESGVLSGERQYVSMWFGLGAPQRLHQDFTAVPRRSRMLECRFYEYLPGGKGGNYRAIGGVKFPNPLFAEFPHWQPEPLPVAKMAGDVEVILEGFSAGHGQAFGVALLPDGRSVRNTERPKPGEEVHASFDLSFQSPRGTNEQWSIESAELSDATGNQLKASSRNESGRHFAIAPTPWPNERAWKLRLELERKGEFLPDELVTFTMAVPSIGETNSVALVNSLAGVTFKRVEFRRKDDLTGGSWSSASATCIRLEHSKVPQGYSLDFVKMVAGNGAKVEALSRSWSDEHSEFFVKSIPDGVESIDITYAVQQTRTVEFLVKPEAAPQDQPK